MRRTARLPAFQHHAEGQGAHRLRVRHRAAAGRLGELSDAYIERIAKCYEVDAGRLKESLAAAKMDAEALGNAPDWHGFFDALREEGGRE